MDDTPNTIKQHYHGMLLSKSPLERLRMVSRMFNSIKTLARSGILREKPKLDMSQLQRELFLRIYGNDFSDVEKNRIGKKMADQSLIKQTQAAVAKQAI